MVYCIFKSWTTSSLTCTFNQLFNSVLVRSISIRRVTRVRNGVEKKLSIIAM